VATRAWKIERPYFNARVATEGHPYSCCFHGHIPDEARRDSHTYTHAGGCGE